MINKIGEENARFGSGGGGGWRRGNGRNGCRKKSASDERR